MDLGLKEYFALLVSYNYSYKTVNVLIGILNNIALSFNELKCLEIEELKAFCPGFSNEDYWKLKHIDMSKIQAELDRISRSNIKMAWINSLSYPKIIQSRLKNHAPPLLFYTESDNILNKNRIAIIGTRKMSKDGKRIVSELIDGFSDNDISVVSGGANGIDTEAHRQAVQYGLDTIMVLPCGINNYNKRSAGRIPFDKVLLLSQFHPDSIWKTEFALMRNNLICAMSSAVVVVEAGLKGGTMHAANSALRMNVPLYVISPGEFIRPPEGNQKLINAGGHELSLPVFFNKPLI